MRNKAENQISPSHEAVDSDAIDPCLVEGWLALTPLTLTKRDPALSGIQAVLKK